MHRRLVAAEPRQQLVDDREVGPRLTRRLDQPRPVENARMATPCIIVVVLEEHRRRQHDVGHLGRLGHELLVDHGEEALARKAFAGPRLVRRDVHRVGVLDE
jgi:hypothetical protein